MRLEPLCDFDMYYRGEGVWLKPYGEKEAAGYGAGDGEATGPRLHGKMVWSNHPRRREDTPDVRRAIVATVGFRASDPQYRWPNFVIGVGEGEIEESPTDTSDLDHWTLRVFACVNEVAKAPPAIR